MWFNAISNCGLMPYQLWFNAWNTTWSCCGLMPLGLWLAYLTKVPRKYADWNQHIQHQYDTLVVYYIPFHIISNVSIIINDNISMTIYHISHGVEKRSDWNWNCPEMKFVRKNQIAWIPFFFFPLFHVIHLLPHTNEINDCASIIIQPIWIINSHLNWYVHQKVHQNVDC